MGLKEQVESHLSVDAIVDLYSDIQHVKHEGNGGLIGQCPFTFKHSGKKKHNFSIDTDPKTIGRYNCFGCQSTGNMYTYLKEVKGIEKPLLYLADHFGIEAAIDQGHRPEKQIIPSAVILAAKKSLLGKENEKAVSMLETMGIRRETMAKYNLGWSAGRYWIPIKDEHGDYVNVRKYNPLFSGGYKVISYAKGYGENRLWPIESLSKKNKDQPIYIFEGEKDTLTALSLDLNAITSTAGAGAWKMIEWGLLFKGKDVIICMDIDSEGVSGADKRAKSIRKYTDRVRIVTLDLDVKKYPHGDFSDYITQEGRSLSDFLELVNKAENYELSEEDADEDEKKESKNKLTSYTIMYDFQEVYKLILPYDKNFYRYNGGVYGVVDELELKGLIQKFVFTRYEKEPSPKLVKDVVLSLESEIFEKDKTPDSVYLNFTNGLLNLSSFKLQEHKRDVFSVNQVPAVFDVLGKYECPRWVQFLDEVLEGDQERICLIQEMFGYCLTRSTAYQKAFMLYGSGANGKSVLLSILEKVVGRSNVSNVAFTSLSEKFAVADLHNKLCNISGEIDFNRVASLDCFKSITAGDTIMIEQKYRKAFSYTPFVKLIYATNELPVTRDRTDGYYRRFIIIPFNREFKGAEIDYRIGDKLEAELEGIVGWAIEGLKRLKKRGEFIEPSISKEEMTIYRKESSSLMMFIEEQCELRPSYECDKDHFVFKYKEFCTDNSYGVCSTHRMTKELRRNKDLKISLKHSGSRYYYMGVKIVNKYGNTDGEVNRYSGQIN